MTKRLVLARVLAILAAGLAAGCADDGALSKEQYVAKLNAMCTAFREEEKEIGDPRTLADLVAKGPRVLDAFERTIVDEIRNLEAPDEIADQADRLVDLAHEQRDVLAALIDAAKVKDFAEVRELAAKNDALNEEASSIARELGAEGCAQD